MFKRHHTSQEILCLGCVPLRILQTIVNGFLPEMQNLIKS